MYACCDGAMGIAETDVSALDVVLARIRQSAGAQDRKDGDLAEEIAWLHAHGLLVEALPAEMTGVLTWSAAPTALSALLKRLGYASLPVGRLFEGHVNAAQLIGLYGGTTLHRTCADAVRRGALLGVWGADGETPVLAQATGEGFLLSGSKIFCSGLGVVQTALISAGVEGRTQLFAVDVKDMARADPGQWDVSGMRATRSGGYDFDGVRVHRDACVGGPDDFFVEPYFLGGMYRMCAVQVGGLHALVDETAASLRRRRRTDDDVAQFRVGHLASLHLMAQSATDRLAVQIADGEPAAAVARDAVLVREGVERCIVAALEIAERSLGTEMHRETKTASRLRRDLSFYIRQAAVDERLKAVGRFYLQPTPDEGDGCTQGRLR